MDTETAGAAMCTLRTPPTRRRTVAVNLVLVFITCGGCFSMIKVPVTRLLRSSVTPARSSGRTLDVFCGSPNLSLSPSSCLTCCRIVQMMSARPSHHSCSVSRLKVMVWPLPASCCSRFHLMSSLSRTCCCTSFTELLSARTR